MKKKPIKFFAQTTFNAPKKNDKMIVKKKGWSGEKKKKKKLMESC